MSDKVTITLALPKAISEWIASGSKKKSINPEDFIVSALAEMSVQGDEERKENISFLQGFPQSMRKFSL